MRFLFGAALITLGACASAPRAPADSRPVWEQHVSWTCPIPEGKVGYPIVARAQGVDAATLQQIARAVGVFWPRIPRAWEDTLGKPEDRHAAVLQRFATPHVPLHRKNWTPRVGDTATLELLYPRDEAPRLLQSGGSGFHQRVTRAVQAAIAGNRTYDQEWRDTLPQVLPAPAADSTIIQLRFGIEPGPGDGVARFAIMEKEVSLKGRHQPPWYPEAARTEGRQGEVRVAFVLDEAGKADMRTAQVLRFDHHDMALSVADFMAKATFTPHLLDCAAVTEVLLQPFNFKLSGWTGFDTRRPPQ